MKTKLLLVALAFIGFYGAKAQVVSNASHTATLTLTNAIELTFTSGSGGVSMTFSTPDHYQNGVTADNAASIRVRSNRAYNVTVKTATANFSSSSTTTMPVSVLGVKEANQASYVSLSSSDQNLLTSQSRGSNTFNLSYRANPGFNYDGGTYTVSVIYTATQQ
jgi:hypothetical protein